MLAPLCLVAVAVAVSRPALLSSPTCSAVRRAPHACMAEGIKVDVRMQPKSSVALDIDIPEAVSKAVHAQVLSELGKTAKVDGFRKGKVPKEALIAKLGMERLKLATFEQLIDVAMAESGPQVPLQTCGDARLVGEVEDLAKKYEPGKPVSFSIEVDVIPQVPLEESMYEALQVSVEKEPFNQDAYDKALLTLREQNCDLEEAEGSYQAQEGNQLLIDMAGFSAKPDGGKGEPLPAVAGGEGVELHLKPGKFMPGLVEGLIGIRAGETRDITVTFPQRSSVPQLAGKAAVFEVSCSKVQRRILPEVDDAFAARVKTGMSCAELDEKLREGVEAESESNFRKAAHRKLEQALVKALPAEFEVPDTLLEQVSKDRFAGMLADAQQRGASEEQIKELITKENYARYLKMTAPMSAIQVKADFSLKEVARQQGLSVSRDAVEDELVSMQAQAMQRGEKFKESEARPRIEAQRGRRAVRLEPSMTLLGALPRVGADGARDGARLAAGEGHHQAGRAGRGRGDARGHPRSFARGARGGSTQHRRRARRRGPGGGCGTASATAACACASRGRGAGRVRVGAAGRVRVGRDVLSERAAAARMRRPPPVAGWPSPGAAAPSQECRIIARRAWDAPRETTSLSACEMREGEVGAPVPVLDAQPRDRERT
uniref:peptidylprolyl isomerase n=1 Tax=Emiliania huxleyi TaxID=2903 RepID=A0A7S3T6W3_EMIHU